MFKVLKDKIEKKTAGIGIVGLGYVGLPLAVAFAEEGFKTVGIDVSSARVRSLASGRSYIMDIPEEKVKDLVSSGALEPTTDFSALKKLDAVIICVPTPLGKTRVPDISFIIKALQSIINNRRKGQLYILESTSYPGTTEEILLPKFQQGSFKLDRDFFLAFSPERVDPSNKDYSTGNIPKVVGGVTAKSTELAGALYGKVISQTVTVSSSKVAEMSKLLENTFRSVNIALVNELALMCDRLNVDVWEVINAAKTKPFGFVPFYPGPGIGGHCINIDPLYLSWKANLHGFKSRLIEVADSINSSMPQYVVNKVISVLNKRRKPVKDARILIMGVTYKKDVNDTRESPSLEIIRLFLEQGAIINFSDPYVSAIRINGKRFRSIDLKKTFLRRQDCVILATDHSEFDYAKITGDVTLVFDTRNAFYNAGIRAKHIIRL